MNIWLINPHDAIPGESWVYRHGLILSETLASEGHNVTYWASNFSHATKQFRCQGWGEIRMPPHIRILLVPVTPYTKHASVERLRSLWNYAWHLWQRARVESKPDCIIISMPTPFTDYVAVKLSKHYKAFLITDFRDLWPEIFKIAFPIAARKIADFFCCHFIYHVVMHSKILMLLQRYARHI